MPVGLERRHEGLFERQAGIVTADCDSHGLAAAILSPPAIRHQVLGKLMFRGSPTYYARMASARAGPESLARINQGR